MEYLDVVNENNELTGKTEERDTIHKNGIWHREVTVWIMNKEGEILLQKRAATKKQYPNKWALCAGHIDAGEHYEAAMLREIYEELGIKLTIDELDFLGIYKVMEKTNNIQNNYFNYTYFFKTDLKVEDYKIELKELSEVKYITLKELEENMKTGNDDMTFISRPYMPEILEILKDKVMEE